MPHASHFSQVCYLEETWGNGACEGTQAVLAIFWQIARRKFASFRLHRRACRKIQYGVPPA